MSSFLAATRIVRAAGAAYTGAAANVLDADPATYCDLYLTGDAQADFLRLDTGAAGQSIASVTLQNVAAGDAQHPVGVFVSDAAAPDGSGNLPGSAALVCTATNPQATAATYVFTGAGVAGRYVYVRLIYPQGSSAQDSLTIGGAIYSPPLTAPRNLRAAFLD